ncbi:MAG TPA: carboxypeptidase regulatory-like domain-containing protein [Blastocatellia bacterium]|nr:carboxypeptidase regulatory-like domain-containing protein [Blastocatellia bacterium]
MLKVLYPLQASPCGEGRSVWKGWFSLIIGLLFLAMGTQDLMAQATGSATLRGIIKDQNGAVVPKASVTLINEATKGERKTQSTEAGIYVFGSVTPGTYSVKVENQGFKTTEQTGITLSPSDTRGLDIALQIGSTSESVTVAATGDTLQTETGAKENTITAKQIENLSIISRSSLELLRILPGVVAPDAADLESVSFGGGANRNAGYNVNGLRGENNTVSVDGARMMDIGSNNGTVITANPDMVQEVKVQTSNYAAEHGTSSVLINATTKGGSSAYHGSLYDYSRDYRLGANDRSNTSNAQVIQKPASQYNYPGGNIGGPVYLPKKIFGPLGGFNKGKDKLFFFTGFEYYYQRVDEGSALGIVPTLKQRTGDFSEFLGLSRPFLGQGGGVVADPVNGTIVRPDANGNPVLYRDSGSVLIPAGLPNAGTIALNNNLAAFADPTGLGRALMNLYPKPNYTDPSGANNYVYSVLRPNDRNQFITRLDYSVSEKTKLYVRLAREYETQGFPRGLWWDSSNYELPGDLTSKNLGRSVVVNVTNIINPSMTNEVLFGASKLKLNYDYADPDKVSYSALGVTKTGFFNNTNPYIPVSITPWGANGLGNLHTAYGYPILAWNDSFAVTDNLTKVFNSHTLKFGAFVEQANKRQQSNSDTNIELAQWGQSTGTTSNFGDLFTGHPIQYTMGSDRPLDNFRYYNFEFYGQDSWKVKSNFTMEYGVRVAYLPNNFERKGLGVLFDPKAYQANQGIFINNDPNRPNGILRAATGEIPKGVLGNNAPAIMPRLNFAWDVGGKGDLVVRAGAGIFYNRVQGNYDYYSSGIMPNSYRATVGTWAVPNGLTFGDLNSINPFSNIANVDITSRDLNSNDLPRVANMSLTVEKRLPSNNILTVAYVGTQGRHLPQQRQINFVQPGTLFSNHGVNLYGSDLTNPIHRVALDDAAVKLFKPYGNYDSIGVYQFTGTSSYHSLQATLSRQAGKGLQYFATYTFSKALGTTAVNETDGAAWADPIDTRGRSWGVLPFDRTHVINLSYNYNFPNLAFKAIDKPVVRGLLNGWQMSGITTFQSGTPVRLRFFGDLASGDMARAWYGTDAFNISGNNTGAITPVYLKNPSVSNNKKIGDRILDPSAFAIPSFGNSGPYQVPYYLRYPSRSNFDVSLFKTFKISESKSFQFRSGFFNIFNQAYPTRIDANNPSNSDINLNLNTVCNRTVSGVPIGTNGGTPANNVCDPTGGFSFTQDTLDNFGKITRKRGRRVIELALKFYF